MIDFRYIGKRLVKSPKVYLTDTALLMSLIGVNSLDDYDKRGAVFENFVATELTKHIASLGGYKLYQSL